jgi:ankyrin repeat protein
VQAGYPLINDEEGKNPLFYAVENNNDIRIIELLAGMLVNNKPAAAAIDNYRMTPLFFCKTIDAAKILLAHDCDPNVVNIDGCTALHFMAKNSLELIEFILAITPDNLIVRDTDGDTLISLMIEDNRVDDVIYLLKKKYPYTSELLEYYQSITEDKQLLSFLQTC